MSKEHTPSIRIVDNNKIKNYQLNVEFLKKQWFINIVTKQTHLVDKKGMANIYERHWIQGLQFIFNEAEGVWEIWWPKWAIKLLTEKIKSPEQRRIEEVRLSVKNTMSSLLDNKPTSSLDSPGMVIW